MEIDNEIEKFSSAFSQVLKERFQIYEEKNKKNLFNKLKELNSEMRNSNNYLITGIKKETSDSLYQKNSNILKEKKRILNLNIY